VVRPVEELAKNGAGLLILADNDEEPTEISVQIAGVIHDEVPDTPALYDSVVHNENAEPEHEDNRSNPVEVDEVVDPSQRINNEDDAEAPTIAVHDAQDFAAPMIAVHDVQDFEVDTVLDEDGDENHADNEDDVDTSINDQMDVQYGSRSGRYSLQPCRLLDYGHLHHLVHDKLKNFTNQRKKGYYGSHVICTQNHINKGLKVFGKRGEEAVATELRQLHV